MYAVSASFCPAHRAVQGMSGDYVEAIKEGATMLRVGTAIFGERSYSKQQPNSRGGGLSEK